MPDLSYEHAHHLGGRVCIGLDEVGRGCIAGPVVAAAVILPAWLVQAGPNPTAESLGSQAWWLELDDSKRLSAQVRERLAAAVQAHAQVSIAWSTVEEIDRWNILRAALLAMRRALAPLAAGAHVLLVDGTHSPLEQRFGCGASDGAHSPQSFRLDSVETIPKGDSRVCSIAAASVVAKVYRDRWMQTLEKTYPGYAFAQNKGYGVASHLEGLRRLGPCREHRKSFAPVAAFCHSDATEAFGPGLALTDGHGAHSNPVETSQNKNRHWPKG